MEGLTSGWRKSVKWYHFFEENSPWSICTQANFIKSEFKKIVFLSEIELTPDMIICKNCYHARQIDIKHQIKATHQKKYQRTLG